MISQLRNIRDTLDILYNVKYSLKDLEEDDSILFNRVVGDVVLEKVEQEISVLEEKLGTLERMIVEDAREG